MCWKILSTRHFEKYSFPIILGWNSNFKIVWGQKNTALMNIFLLFFVIMLVSFHLWVQYITAIKVKLNEGI